MLRRLEVACECICVEDRSMHVHLFNRCLYQGLGNVAVQSGTDGARRRCVTCNGEVRSYMY